LDFVYNNQKQEIETPEDVPLYQNALKIFNYAFERRVKHHYFPFCPLGIKWYEKILNLLLIIATLKAKQNYLLNNGLRKNYVGS